MKSDFKISSGNVFKDIGVKNPYSEQMRAELALELFKTIKKKKLTQTKAAEILGLKQPNLSKLKSGNFSHFTIESLLKYLNKLNKKVLIKISDRKAGEEFQKVQA
jgi:predicted XRE-type DNA-binding protein